MASIIERIDSGCASNPIRILICLTAPPLASVVTFSGGLLGRKMSLYSGVIRFGLNTVPGGNRQKVVSLAGFSPKLTTAGVQCLACKILIGNNLMDSHFAPVVISAWVGKGTVSELIRLRMSKCATDRLLGKATELVAASLASWRKGRYPGQGSGSSPTSGCRR